MEKIARDRGQQPQSIGPVLKEARKTRNLALPCALREPRPLEEHVLKWQCTKTLLETLNNKEAPAEHTGPAARAHPLRET